MNEQRPSPSNAVHRAEAGPAPYWNPYLAGLLLGAALLASFLTLGAGLGASAAPARFGAYLESCIAPTHALAQRLLRQVVRRRRQSARVLSGVHDGGYVPGRVVLGSARATRGRVRRTWRGDSSRRRLLYALVGGLIVGYASRLADGCTSGQALTGGALLMNGSLVFMICVFAGGYATAWFVRRQWHD